MPEPPDRLAGQSTPAGLGVHPAIGGGPLPAYTRRPHDERLRAVKAVEELAARAADAGMFSLFLGVHPDQAAAYKFGREPDGSPAEPWSWSEPAGR